MAKKQVQPNCTASEAALVYGQMNEPPGARARVALTGLTGAEYFRDEEGQARRRPGEASENFTGIPAAFD